MKYSTSAPGYRLPPISEDYAAPLRIRAATEGKTLRQIIEEALDMRLQSPPTWKGK